MSTKLPPISIGFSDLPFKSALTMAKEADKAGFYSTGVAELVRDSLTYLAAVAVVTRNIKLATTVATWTRTPVNMARAARDVDIVSGGRLMLGLGSMPQSWNRDFHGIPPEHPVQRMREYVELLRLLWKSSPDTQVDYAGKFYRVVGYRMYEPPPRPHLPILIGASRLNMMRSAAEYADGIMFNWNYTIPFLREKALPAILEGARKSGRTRKDLHLTAGRPVILDDDPRRTKEAVDRWRRSLAYTYMPVDYHQELLKTHGFGDEVAAANKAIAAHDFEGVVRSVSDRMVNEFIIVGTPDQCLERVSQFTGLVDSFSVQSVSMGVTGAEKVKSLRRMIEVFKDGAL